MSIDYHITENFKRTWQKKIISWYGSNKRDLPWRKKKNQNFYRIWISEVMLQQTQLKIVLLYWNKWMKAFPVLEDLVNADEEEILLIYFSLVVLIQFALNFLVIKLNPLENLMFHHKYLPES